MKTIITLSTFLTYITVFKQSLKNQILDIATNIKYLNDFILSFTNKFTLKLFVNNIVDIDNDFGDIYYCLFVFIICLFCIKLYLIFYCYILFN